MCTISYALAPQHCSAPSGNSNDFDLIKLSAKGLHVARMNGDFGGLVSGKLGV